MWVPYGLSLDAHPQSRLDKTLCLIVSVQGWHFCSGRVGHPMVRPPDLPGSI